MNNQLKIINQVRTWIGTRFQHQGRIKRSATDNGGVDCIGLVLGVAAELEIILPDQTGYSRIPDSNMLLKLSRQYLKSKPLEQLDVTDIILLRIEQEPQHFAIIGNGPYGPTLIHSYAPLKQVVEHHLDDFWRKRIVAAFAFPE